MRKKLLFLAVCLAVCGAPLTSCSKDDGRRDPSENLKSVDGTEWVATKATINFRNGKYTIDCLVPGGGTYTQNGNYITFDGNTVVLSGGSVRLTEGVISKYGDSMTVTFKDASIWNTGDVETLRFTYNILAD